jgi:hypothetical protein
MDPGAGDKLAGVIRGIFATGKMGVRRRRGPARHDPQAREDLRGHRAADGRRAQPSRRQGHPRDGDRRREEHRRADAARRGPRPRGRPPARSRQRAASRSRPASRASAPDRAHVLEAVEVEGREGVREGPRQPRSDIFNPDTASGKHDVQGLQHLSDIFAKFLEPLTGPDGKKRMEEFFDSLAEQPATASSGSQGKARGVHGLRSRSGRRHRPAAATLRRPYGTDPGERRSRSERAAHVRRGGYSFPARPMDSFTAGSPAPRSTSWSSSRRARGLEGRRRAHRPDVAAQKRRRTRSPTSSTGIATQAGAHAVSLPFWDQAAIVREDGQTVAPGITTAGSCRPTSARIRTSSRRGTSSR